MPRFVCSKSGVYHQMLLYWARMSRRNVMPVKQLALIWWATTRELCLHMIRLSAMLYLDHVCSNTFKPLPSGTTLILRVRLMLRFTHSKSRFNHQMLFEKRRIRVRAYQGVKAVCGVEQNHNHSCTLTAQEPVASENLIGHV